MGRQYSSRAGPYCQGFFMKPHVAFTRYRLSHVLGDTECVGEWLAD